MNNSIYKIKPIFKSKVWGGSYFKKAFNHTKLKEPLGEVWLVSGLIESSVFKNGPYKHQTINEVFKKDAAFFGYKQAQLFPLLIKLIEAKQNLSVQVHPDDEYAFKNKLGYGKNEAWYILKAKRDAKLFLGTSLTSKKAFKQVLNSAKVVKALGVFKPSANEIYDVKAKTIHAIGKGILLYEVQQSSDTTFRVYDFPRDSKKSKRELHLKQALAVTDLKQYQNQVLTNLKHKNYDETILENSYFKIRVIKLIGSAKISLSKGSNILGVVKGKGKINNQTFKLYDHGLTNKSLQEIEVVGNLTLVIVTPAKQYLIK